MNSDKNKGLNQQAGESMKKPLSMSACTRERTTHNGRTARRKENDKTGAHCDYVTSQRLRITALHIPLPVIHIGGGLFSTCFLRVFFSFLTTPSFSLGIRFDLIAALECSFWPLPASILRLWLFDCMHLSSTWFVIFCLHPLCGKNHFQSSMRLMLTAVRVLNSPTAMKLATYGFFSTLNCQSQ